uniref:Actin-interacting protein 1 n=1 Tax=Phallusia mammillata TaxID=59560 RepID=A0A6F9DWY5_9ASCI|nr:actin-interacting protein 1 [Phallusia mammillata]
MVKIDLKSSFAPLPPTERATALVLGPDPKGKNILYCSGNAVIIRDIENPLNYEVYAEHQKPPKVAKYSHTGFYICSGDTGGKVRIWDTTQSTHILKYEYQPISGAIRDIAWDADSKRIAVCGQGKEKFAHAFLWDSGSSIGSLDKIGKSSNSVDIKRTRPYRCVVGSEDFSAYFYEGPPFRHFNTLSEGIRFCNCVRFSPDGKYMASANSDGNIFLYDGKSAEFIAKFGEKGHVGGVYSICFSPDGTELLSASADKTAKIWNVETRQQTVEFVLGKDIMKQQLSCLWQGDYLLTVSLTGEINYLDRNDPSKPAKVVTGHNKTITCTTIKPKEAIYSASFDGVVVRWDAYTGDGKRFTGLGHASKVTAMLYVEDTNTIVSIGLDNAVRFTDADSCDFDAGKSVTLESQPTSIDLTNEGAIVVACEKEVVMIKDGNKVVSQSWSANHPAKIVVSGSTMFASGKKQGSAHTASQACDTYTIDGSSITRTDQTIPLQTELTTMACSPNGAKLAVADGKVISVFDLADGFSNPTKLSGHSNSVSCLAWSPDSLFLASGSTDTNVMAWDVDSGKKALYTAAHPKKPVTGVIWFDNNTFVSVGEDCAVCQWSVSR